MKYVIANWKMNFNKVQMFEWVEIYKSLNNDTFKNTKILVAPSLPYFSTVAELEEHGVGLCSQNVSEYTNGAYTGEVASFQLKDFCNFCIVGHSERHEPLDTVLRKRDLCLKESIVPIVCVADPDLAKHVYCDGIIVAWEDPNNISVGGVYKEKDTNTIETTLNQMKAELPKESILIYGGSVNKINAPTLASIKTLGGVLIGNASLNAKEFIEIIKEFDL